MQIILTSDFREKHWPDRFVTDVYEDEHIYIFLRSLFVGSAVAFYLNGCDYVDKAGSVNHLRCVYLIHSRRDLNLF